MVDVEGGLFDDSDTADEAAEESSIAADVDNPMTRWLLYTSPITGIVLFAVVSISVVVVGGGLALALGGGALSIVALVCVSLFIDAAAVGSSNIDWPARSRWLYAVFAVVWFVAAIVPGAGITEPSVIVGGVVAAALGPLAYVERRHTYRKRTEIGE